MRDRHSPLASRAPSPAVSIIMLAHGTPAMLEASLTSVRSQSWAQWDMLVLSDGTDEPALALLETVARADPRIRILAATETDRTRLRNQGIAATQAPLVAFLEAGDLWAVGRLANHLALHRRNPTLAATYDRIAFLAPEASALVGARRHSRLRSRPLTPLDMLGDDPACMPCNVLLRRHHLQALGGFDTGLPHAQEQDLLARLVGDGARIEGIDAVLTGHRPRGGLCAPASHIAQGWRQVILRHAEGGEARRLEAAQCRLIVLRVLRSGGRIGHAMPHLLRGMQLNPFVFVGGPRQATAMAAGFTLALALPPRWRRRLLA